jgi:type II secretory pathway component PulF
MLFVLPTLGGLYDMVGAQLPAPTRIVMSIADFIKNYWIWLIVGIIGGIALIRFLVTNVIPVKRVYEHIKFAIPVVNKVAITPEYLRLSKTLRSAYVNGLPVVDVLNLTMGVMSHQIYKDKIKSARDMIIGGMPLHEAFRLNGFDSLLWRSIALGEESGRLEESLTRYIGVVEDEFNAYLGTLTAAVEPFALIFVGVVVGFIVLSLYLPMFDMIPTLLGSQ